MIIPFFKYHGTGNDFVILDNRNNNYDHLTEEDIRKICHRHFGIGADGLMLFQQRVGFDFEMIYFNSDGKPGTMCGNGARCMVQFAADQGIKKFTYKFQAADGIHEAEFDTQGWVRLKMANVYEMREEPGFFMVNTGSPHYVLAVKSVKNTDVTTEGREIRNSAEFAVDGINVNFVERLEVDTISVRTYERGVEEETMSCGTGVTASALAFAHNPKGFNNVEVVTPGGMLHVEFNKINNTSFEDIWLCGPAEFVYSGEYPLN